MMEQLTIQECDDVNDIPEGLARIEAMNHAVATAAQGEDPREILLRAGMYYAFLTFGKKNVMNPGMLGAGEKPN